ncbi:sensor histidine kinase [Sedimentibacter saalensis]|uniref:Sensor histidine kinase YesM n=1 Tax=Sedimentibacter saalensis TaxID=130788 RepID=A0A562JBT8_9FIRM|nr:sensor histidine kinase [Sedimentibacter saalensis]TWH80553.1 sensor histidine kinase YesM [Sedimentibacter saalensis]
MTSSATIVYLIVNLFGAYIIFRFISVFFDRTGTDKKIEFVSYAAYYFIINLLFLAFNNPVVNVAANLIMFFLLTYNYHSSMKTRLIAAVSVYTVLMIIETLVILIMQHFDVSIISRDKDLAVISGMVSIKIVSYIVVLFISNFKMVRNNINVSYLHWLSIFVIPAGTLVSALMLMTQVNPNNLTGMTASIVILFIINIFVFYLYDALMKSYDEKMDKLILLQQNNAYMKQLDIINQSQENIKTIRHDIKNHVLSLKVLIEGGDKEGASDYLDTMIDYINYSGEYAKSGNAEFDSIINYKIDKARMHGIKSEINLKVPDKLNIRPFDLSVVLGNLLDNAIEAAAKAEEKVVRVNAELERNVLYINIANSFDGKLNYKDGKLDSTKTDNEKHGIGLNSVMKSVENYNGTMSIHHSDNMFFADVLIYNYSSEAKA